MQDKPDTLADTQTSWPLSDQQKYLWQQTHPKPQFNQLSVIVEPQADIKQLQQRFNEVLEQHHIFASDYALTAGLRFAEQIIKPYIPIEFNQGMVKKYGISIDFTVQTRQLTLKANPLIADNLSLLKLWQQVTMAESDDDDEITQYGEFARWQQDLLSGDEAPEAMLFWQSIMIKEQAAITTSATHPLSASFKTARPLNEQLLLTAWFALQHKLNDTGVSETKRCVSVQFDSRHQYPELADALGPYSQFLAMQIDIPTDCNGSRLLALVEEQSDLYNQWLEFCPLTAQPEIATHNGWHFEYLQTPATADIQINPANAQIQLSCQHTAQQVQFKLTIADDSLPIDFKDNLLTRYVKLLEQLLESPNKPIAQLDISLKQDMNRYQPEVNDSLMVQPIVQMISNSTIRSGQQTAVVFNQNTLNWQQLDEQSLAFAHYLQGLNLAANAPVILCLERSTSMVVALLGCLKAGFPYVPVDPDHNQQRLAALFEQLQAPVLVSDSQAQFAPLFDGIIVSIEQQQWLAEPHSQAPLPAIDPQQLAYIIYTSGSTGTPKGVAISHQNLSHYVSALTQRLNLAEKLNFASVSTLSADLGNTAMFGALASGGCLHLVDFTTATDGELFAQYLQNQHIDVLKIVPSHFKALAASAAEPQKLLPQQALIFGGESFDRPLSTLLTRLQPAKLKPAGNLQVYNHYGPTEATIGCFMHRITQSLMDQPIGTVLGNNRFVVMSAQGQLSVPGCTGELWVTGPGISPGYYQDSANTAKSFVQHQQTRYYRTGDKVSLLDDNTLAFAGRIDNQVKIRGYRIELDAIVDVLLSHDDILDAQVLVENQQLIACLVQLPRTKDQQNDGLDKQLTRLIGAKLPAYMIPNNYVTLPQLPLTANGKLDRKQLLLLVHQANQITEQQPLQTATEQQLALLWQPLLGAKIIARNSHFFNLGGHSLLATQLVFRIRQQLGANVALGQIFDYPTLGAMAEFIDTLDAQAVDVAIPPIDSHQTVPLSHAQQRLWFLQQLAPDSGFYNVPAILRFEGDLCLITLQSAFDTLTARHRILTTRFSEIDGQICHFPCELPSEKVTITAAINSASQSIEDEAKRPFNLLNETPLRLVIYPQNTLLVVMHHIVCDGWSRDILIQQLAEAYEAHQLNKKPNWPTQTLQYRDFAHWQINQGVQLYAKELRYWQQHLGNDHAPLQLNTDYPRPAQQSYQGNHYQFELCATLTDQLTTLGQNHDATLFMTLLAGWHALLYRYSGQSQIRVGIPMAGRDQSELAQMVGLLANTLVTQSKPTSDLSFSELLTHIRQSTRAAFDQQNLPFEQLVRALQPQRSASYSPLFQAFFSLQPARPAAIEFADLTVTLDSPTIAASKFDVSLMLHHNNDGANNGISATLEYDSALFKPATLERMAANFKTLLQAIIVSPEQPINQLLLLSGCELRLLNQAQPQTKVQTEPQEKVPTFLQRFEQHCQNQPDATAIIFNGMSISYQHLATAANDLAAQIQLQGAQPGQRIVLQLHRSPTIIAAILAALKTDVCFVPLDPNLPQARIEYIIEQSDPVLILSDKALTNREVINPQCESTGAYIIYTSGSTGQPKGVEVSRAALDNQLDAMRQAINGDEHNHWLARTTISFDISLLELLMPLHCAGQLVLATDRENKDPQQLIKLIAQTEVNVIQATPGAWHQLLDCSWQAPRAITLLSGGETLTPQLASQLLKQSKRVFNLYGPTEATIWASCKAVFDSNDISLGLALNHYQHYIFNSSHQQQPIGVMGELAIGGAGVANGYFNQPQLTQSRFIDNPFGPGKLYLTGDLATKDQHGNIHYHGRDDNQIKWRGYRIELDEIVQTLQQHSAVNVAHCRLQQDWLLCYYTTSDSQPHPDEALKDSLRQWLPEYMLPSQFIHLEQMPLSNSGKIDNCALAGLQHQADVKKPQSTTGQEQQIIKLWQKILGQQSINPDDNFFALGGHSLLLTRLLAIIKQQHNVTLPLYQLMIADTPAKQARLVFDLTSNNQFLVKSGDPVQLQPLSFAQQRLYFLHHFISQPSAYNVPLQVELDQPISPTKLQQCLNRLVNRHAQLRTAFINTDHGPRQIAQQSITPVTIIKNACKSVFEGQAQQPFDLTKAPLLRVVISDNKLLVVMHHIIVDGWSIEQLAQELMADYMDDQQPSTPAFDYVDFSHYQQQLASTGELDSQLDYWQNYLAGGLPILSLSLDKPRPAQQTFNGARASLRLTNASQKHLLNLAQCHQTSRFSVMMSLYAMVLARYANQDEVCIGTPIANRHIAGSESIIGLFANTVVYRCQLTANRRFTELLQTIKHDGLLAQQHQDLPFEQLVDAIMPTRDTAYTPLFQTMLIVQETALKTDQESSKNPHFKVKQLDQVNAKFDTTLVVQQNQLSIEYNSDLFSQGFMQGLLASLGTLIDDVGNDDSRLLAHYVQRSDTQRLAQQQWNQTDTHYPLQTALETTVLDDIINQCRQNPRSIALQMDNQQQSVLSYQQLDQISDQIAHRLNSLTVNKKAVVAILFERSLAMVAAVLGVMKAEAAYLPLGTDIPQSRLAFMINDADVEVLLVHSDLLDIALQLATTVCTTYARKLVIQTLDDHFDNLHRFGGEPLLTSPEPHDCAYVIYTSGSTGEPKGVEVPHLGLKNRLCWQQQAFNLQADDVVLHKTPYNFDVSVWELLWPLMIGAKLVIALPNAHKDPAAIAQLCQQTRVNVIHFVPSMLQAFIDEAELELPDLTLLICSGEALPASLAQKTLKQLPHTALYNLYGPTEASIDVSYYQCQADDESWQIPIGKPIANTCLYVLDQQHNPLPSGAIGELYIAGSGLASGYLNRPQLNYERFIKAEIDGKVQRLYRTGDLARWRMDGELEYLGRCDSQIKLRGLRIELAEIEALLSRHNAIEQAVVLAVPQEQPEYLQACVTLNENGRHLSQTDILQTLAEQLPDYMVPSSLVVVDKMPTNANGKTDRKQLAKITLALADNTFEQLDSNNRQSPKTDLEYSLVKLLSDMLKQPKVMLQDDLFTLGAHSLWLVKLQRQLLKHFGVQVPLNQLMSHKKVCQLVDLIANTPTQHVENDLMPLVQCEQKDAPTLYCIHPGSGLSSQYQTLAQSLSTHVNVVGINATQALKSGHYTMDIEQLARHYIEQIQSQQPQGPYYLLGWSLGAHIALAMTHQLEANNSKVAWLGCVDALLVPGYHQSNVARNSEFYLNCLRSLKPDWQPTQIQIEQLTSLIPSNQEGNEQPLCQWAEQQSLLGNTLNAADAAKMLQLTHQSNQMVRQVTTPTVKVQAKMAVYWASQTLAQWPKSQSTRLRQQTLALSEQSTETQIDGDHQQVIVEKQFISALIEQLSVWFDPNQLEVL